MLAIAAENNPKDRVFEDVAACRFALDDGEVRAVGTTMQGIADLLCEGEVKNMLQDLI